MLKEFFGENSDIGQSLVEMSVAFVVLAFVLSGVVDLGRLYFVLVTLEDTAGEAAIYVSIEPDCFTAVTGCNDDASSRAQDSVIAWIDPANMQLSCSEISPDPANNCNNLAVDDVFEITVTYPFDFIMPIVSGISGNSNGQITLRSTASQTVIVETD